MREKAGCSFKLVLQWARNVYLSSVSAILGDCLLWGNSVRESAFIWWTEAKTSWNAEILHFVFSTSEWLPYQLAKGSPYQLICQNWQRWISLLPLIGSRGGCTHLCWSFASWVWLVNEGAPVAFSPVWKTCSMEKLEIVAPGLLWLIPLS